MSEYIEIVGGSKLSGTVQVSGAKNAVLPMLIASLLTAEECQFENVPNLEDVNLLSHLLSSLGGDVSWSGETFSVRTESLVATETSYSLVKAMRASFWVLGPLLARGGAARVALPGGDIIGARPVDMHLEALQQMGASISVRHGIVYATAPQGLTPAEIQLRFPSVGATHQIIMAAALTPGVTTIHGAAKEPEICALADMITAMGGSVQGAGTPEIRIEGQERLHGCSVRVIGDRIEAATYLLAGLATRGCVRVVGIDPSFFGSFLTLLTEMGAKVSTGEDWVEAEYYQPLRAVDVCTAPFPGFATDLQAPVMALLGLVDGESTVEETVFSGRFGHVAELCRMGADISVEGRIARISGVPQYSAAPVEAQDIRAAASLVIAAVNATGTTRIFEPHHIRRGYCRLEEKLQKIGGTIGIRMSDPEDYIFTGC